MYITMNDRRPAFDWLKKHWERGHWEAQKFIDRIAEEASDTEGLEGRTKASIRAFLTDLVQDHETVTLARVMPYRAPNFGHGLLSRSLGYSRKFRIRDQSYATLAPSLVFRDLSGEVNSVAFHPNGTTFAVGTFCVTDLYNMQDNNPGSLVIGSVNEQHLVKTADHWRTQQGPICNPEVTDRSWQTPGREMHYTVASVGFSSAGVLYSAGRDGKLLAYGPTDRRIICQYDDEAGGSPPVECMSVARDNNVVAIGRRTAKDSVVVLRHGFDRVGFTASTFSLDKAELRNDMINSPSTLNLGFGRYPNLLVAGYSAHPKTDRAEENASTFGTGHLRLFDIAHQMQISVSPCSHAVFATAWSPNQASYFATACAPVRNKRAAKSLVRIYSPNQTSDRCNLDCHAYDINELAIWYV
jgi:WD40 repeat protein